MPQQPSFNEKGEKTMKRNIITFEPPVLHIPQGEIWMTLAEIAELFNIPFGRYIARTCCYRATQHSL